MLAKGSRCTAATYLVMTVTRQTSLRRLLGKKIDMAGCLILSTANFSEGVSVERVRCPNDCPVDRRSG